MTLDRPDALIIGAGVSGLTTGVRLADGTVVTAARVISNADPKRSLLKLLEPGVLPAKLVRGYRWRA